MNRVIAIIQARMESTRLPGKVMVDLNGKSMLAHVIQRAGIIRGIDQVIVATTSSISDDPIRVEARSLGVGVFSGSREDVLDRVYQAAKVYEGSIIMRLTADCPLLDPKLSRLVLDRFLKGDVDYVSNCLSATYPDGLDTEVCSFEALERAWLESEEKSDREHVTSYIWENPQLFRIGQVVNTEDMTGRRWTIDQPEDLQFIRQLIAHSPDQELPLQFTEIIQILRDHPELEVINRNIVRNEGYLRSIGEN